MEETKAMTLRLKGKQSEELEAIADVEGTSVSDEIRKAIAAHIETKRKDKDFKARLKRSLERNREILDRLSK